MRLLAGVFDDCLDDDDDFVGIESSSFGFPPEELEMLLTSSPSPPLSQWKRTSFPQ